MKANTFKIAKEITHYGKSLLLVVHLCNHQSLHHAMLEINFPIHSISLIIVSVFILLIFHIKFHHFLLSLTRASADQLFMLFKYESTALARFIASLVCDHSFIPVLQLTGTYYKNADHNKQQISISLYVHVCLVLFLICLSLTLRVSYMWYRKLVICTCYE